VAMKPVSAGDRGPAVEDIQRRLLVLGYDLGPAGIDGVLLGHTLGAIREFQEDRGLRSDGMVGIATWAALVDATFTFGDRMLYLRVPHLHGRDVQFLQEALGVLGFSCSADAIFGPRTERAVREFQRNVALPSDGIVGPDTVSAIQNLRHLWEGKTSRVPASSVESLAPVARVLERVSVALRPEDSDSREIAARIANLAAALSPADTNRLELLGIAEEPRPETSVLVRVTGLGSAFEAAGTPLVVLGEAHAPELASRLKTGLMASLGRPQEVIVDVSSALSRDEMAAQHAAVLLLDALAAALE
jgi:peptidoglycan hydrolase-like protein with peptidoglycan-binding domain